MKSISISDNAWKTISLLKLREQLRSMAYALDLILAERRIKELCSNQNLKDKK